MAETVKKRKAKGSEIAADVVFSICLFAGAYFLFDAEHRIWGALVLLFGLYALAQAFSKKEITPRSKVSCAKCGRTVSVFTPPSQPAGVMAFGSSFNHGDMEDWAMYCKECKKEYCGSCCLPKWE